MNQTKEPVCLAPAPQTRCGHCRKFTPVGEFFCSSACEMAYYELEADASTESTLATGAAFVAG